jgi:Na+-transporting NADH:ubiquinone oxidoreductase subunit C
VGKVKGNTYTFVFATAVCAVCSVMLAAVAEGLRPQQEFNAALDIKKNILKAVQLQTPLSPQATAKEISKIYEEKIEEKVIDADGNIIEGKKPSEIKEGEKTYPLYIYKEGEEILAYCYPIVGQGLWSILYGYFAIEPDAVTVRGITFYKHGETPGLGAEIEKDWFQKNFEGKTIWSVKNHDLTPIVVVKGKVANVYKDERTQYAVDGITAATITSNGVTSMLDKWIHIYEPFFEKIRKG